MVIGKRKAVPGQKKAIARGRPPFSSAQNAALSSKATRKLIRSHHNLQKAHANAVAAGDECRALAIQKQIDTNGGLESYQRASTLGQSIERGGDSSKVLVEWLKSAFHEATLKDESLHMLEIGALSTQNACSKIECLEIRRIDLQSQEKGIEEIDFMDLPVPSTDEGCFDIVSLSLVLNFVPTAAARGEMLKHISPFLRHPISSRIDGDLPCLFLVLPLSCVSNSRYTTETKLKEILESLGFSLSKTKSTSKLFYTLWRHDGEFSTCQKSFRKEELRPGGSRNNFAIVLT